MKKSQKIPLYLIGSLAVTTLPGCGVEEPDYPVQANRAMYNSMAECVQDWQDDCDEVSSGGSVHYYGPYYTSTGTVYRLNGSTYNRPLASPVYGRVVNQTVPHSSLKYAGEGVYQNSAKAMRAMSKSGMGHSVSRGGFGGGRGGFGG